MCANLFKHHPTSTSSKSFAAKIQSTSGKPHHNIPTKPFTSEGMTHNGSAISGTIPSVVHSDEEHRAISGRVLHAGFGGDDETSWLCQRLFYPD